ncbi:hypothetical protein PLESTB_000277900 [Pleodorina starrii]|uniref:Uncharacterized protein n=1 Tax=Pleodorina starrii TaxID=330485 RepID=A0A9W6BDD0_9CHLO|nr:hypothetical protein PLESTM_001411400 [Pleodorina starrii]GLC49705.1 hypothetical protein PLESTB_000277900 [Pleodorina starrii]
MASGSELAGVEALATRVKQLLWVVLDSVPAELVPWSLMLVRLLHAADTFPRGGLYDGHYAAQAALRYEVFWLPLAARAQRSRKGHVLVPPLDVAMAWLLHRCTAPGSYPADCEALLGRVLDPPPAQAFRFAGAHAYAQCESPEERQAWASREVWDAAYVHGGGSFDIHSSAAPSPGPASEAPSPRPELGPALPSPRGAGKLAAPAAAAGANGGLSSGGSSSGFGAGGGGGGGIRLQAQFWPPAPRGSRWDLTRLCPLVAAAGGGGAAAAGPPPHGVVGCGGGGAAGLGGRGQLAGRLAGRMGELCPLLHSLLRPAYLDPDVLAQAVQRYCRFLMLQGMHPSVPMVPTTDIALMWVAHMSVPSTYRDTCRRLLGRLVLPAPGALRLDDGGPGFAETRRLYEHHFGEVYDPPLTRAVPLSTPHPLLSTPLAPFLAAFEIAPATGGPDAVLAAAYFDPVDPAAGPASPTARQLLQQREYGNGGGEYGSDVAAAAAGGGGGGCDGAAGGGLHRGGAHALYLAYLMRRGGSRSSRSLFGLVLGQAHRRRAAVKYVGNKAAGFRNFLHLPHSDCHPYWRKLRLRRVDPDSVVESAPSVDGDGDGGAATPDLASASGGGGGSHQGNRAAVQPMDMDELLGGDADSDGGGSGGNGGGGGRNGRRRRGDDGDDDEARQHAVVRQELARAAAAAAAAATATAAAAGAAGGGGFLTPVGHSRRSSWMDPASGTASAPPSGPPSASSGGSSKGGDATSATPPPPPHPRAGGGAVVERPKRISLIVPLPVAAAAPPPPPPSQHSTMTVTPGSSAPSRRSSGPETISGGTSERPSSNQRTTGPGAELPPRPPRPRGTSGHGASAAAAPALPPTAEEVPTVDLAAGLAAVAAAAKAPFQMWAAPRHPPPVSQQQQPQGAGPAAAQAPAATASDSSGGGADSDAPAPSPLHRPSIERRKYEDGTDEWAYNNPYYKELGAPSPLSPLSPLGQTPPPASAAFLAAASAAKAAVDGAAASAAAGGGGAPTAPEAPGTAPQPGAGGGGFGGDVWAVRVAPPDDRQSAGAGAVGAETGGEGSSGRLRPLRSGNLVVEDVGGGGGGGGGAFPAAPGSSTYLSCPSSEEEREGGGDADGAAARKRGGGGGGGRSKDGGSSDGGGGESVYGTPSAAFAAAVDNPFSGPLERDGGGGEHEQQPAAVTAAATIVVTAAAGGAAAAVAGGTCGGGAAAAVVAGPGLGVGGGGACGITRFSGPSTSRLARVTTASPPPPPSLPPPPAAAAAAAAASPGSFNLPRCGSATSEARPSGLPPRPAPSPFPAAAAATAAPGTPKRASGTYGPADVSYMGSLGGVAGLVTRGEESPVFSRSLRERYSGGAGKAAGGAAGGGGGGGVPAGGGDGGSSAGFTSPMVSSSGASFCSATSGRSSVAPGTGLGG